MTATGHAVIGVALAAAIPNPMIGIPIAVLSHIPADLFPHWDIGTNRKSKGEKKFVYGAFADVIISYLVTFLLVAFVFPQVNIVYALAMVFASQFFDWLAAPYVFLRLMKPPIFYWTYKFQKTFDNRLDKPWGIIGQVAILLLLLVFVVKLA